jgi:RimJ/RimL family protein N-acetyltransferase
MLLGRQISLGPIIPLDFPSLFTWANDLDAMRFDAAYRPMDFVTHSQWCETIGRDPSCVVFAIRKLDEPSIIGYVRISNISSVHRAADFGIRIGAEANRGQGYGKEATALALDFCWKHLNLNRVQLIVFSHNMRAPMRRPDSSGKGCCGRRCSSTASGSTSCRWACCGRRRRHAGSRCSIRRPG